MPCCCVLNCSALEKMSHHDFLSPLPSLCLFVFSFPCSQQPNYWSFKVSSNTVFVSRRKSVPPCGFGSNRITVHCVSAHDCSTSLRRTRQRSHILTFALHVFWNGAFWAGSAGRRANHCSAAILKVKLGFHSLQKRPQQLLRARCLLWDVKEG